MTREQTTAPMGHQLPHAAYDKCGECRQFIPSAITPGGLGDCRLGVVREWTAGNGFTAPILLYPRQLACPEFKKIPPGTGDRPVLPPVPGAT